MVPLTLVDIQPRWGLICKDISVDIVIDVLSGFQESHTVYCEPWYRVVSIVLIRPLGSDFGVMSLLGLRGSPDLLWRLGLYP